MGGLKRRLDSNKGKVRSRSSVEREVAGIILRKYMNVNKYEIIDVQECKKKPQLRFWMDEENVNIRVHVFFGDDCPTLLQIFGLGDKNIWSSMKQLIEKLSRLRLQ